MTKFNAVFIYLFPFFSFPASLFAQEPQVTAEITPDTCLIGDNIFYSFTLAHSDKQIFTFPSDTDEVAFYPFEIREKKKLSEEEKNGLVVERLRYTLTIFDTGVQIIPPLSLAYTVGSDLSPNTLSLDSKLIYVRSVLDTSQKDIADIKPVQSLPLPVWVYVVGALLLLALVGGGYGLFTYWQKKRGEAKPIKVEPQKPPYQIAREKLALLEKYPLETQEDYKKFYSDLSDILRELIERHYEIAALEQITSEILIGLARKLSGGSVERFQQVFDKADLVKFAKFFPSKLEARESLLIAKAMVEETAPKADIPNSANEET